ncbi:MAG: hypothetical protein HKN13_06440, partial [Rhodothermales bacterium]|nr:hypothetical protein [Rhodothermales bacterium]
MTKRWSKEAIVETIQELESRDADLSYTGLRKAGYAGMYGAARKHFGSWKNAVRAAGVEASKGSRRHGERRWTKRLVIEAIGHREGQGLPLSHSDVQRHDASLMNGAVRRFDSWKNAVVAAGIDYDKHYRGWRRDTTLGMIFEKLVGELFDELDLPHLRHKRFEGGIDRNYVEPDFVFPGNHWWDAKLNAHAPHVDDCIERYAPMAESLTIVCARGGEREHQSARFVDFEKYVVQNRAALATDRLRHYQDELTKILNCKADQKQLDVWAVRWTKKSIIKEIRARAATGASLLSKDVSKEQPDLYGVSNKKNYFDGWYDAVTHAGFDGDELRAAGREAGRRARIQFPKDWCSKRLKELRAADGDLSVTGLQQSEPELYRALIRHWGTYKRGLSAHGIEPATHLRQVAWTKDSIVSALQERAATGQSITPSDLRNDEWNLANAIRRHFGTLEAAAETAKIEGRITRRSSPWQDDSGKFSESRFRKCLQDRLDEHGLEGLAAGVVFRDARQLYAAARRHMGGWYPALTMLGFDTASIRKGGASTRRRWTDDKLRTAIQDLHEQGADLSVTGMKQQGNLDVYATAAQRFGSWPCALRDAGLNPDDWRRQSGPARKWSTSKVVAEIQRLHQDEADLSVAGISHSHPGLYAVASKTYFKSWSEALQAAGIDPE